MIKEFRELILRGNLVDLAVAVVIGTAFGAVVTALVENIITPLIGAIGGEQDFSSLSFSLNGSEFTYGNLINKVIAFLTIATVVFFLVVKPMNLLLSRFKPEPKPAAETRESARSASATSRAPRVAARSARRSRAPPDARSTSTDGQ